MTRSPAGFVLGIVLIVLMAIGSVIMWVVNPVFWLWLASQLERSSQPSMGPYVMVLVGIPVTMIVVGKALSTLNRAYGSVTGTTAQVRISRPWLRSMRGERDSGRPRTVLDVVMVVSVSVAVSAFLIWFFGFAGSSLPS